MTLKITPLVTGSLVGAFALFGLSAAFADSGGRMWDKLDTDGDGRIAVADIEDRAGDKAAEMDADSDGFITTEEMASYHAAQQAARRAKQFPDRNGDGAVSAAEFASASDERFDALDTNNDGVLSPEEVPERKGRRGGRRMDTRGE